MILRRLRRAHPRARPCQVMVGILSIALLIMISPGQTFSQHAVERPCAKLTVQSVPTSRQYERLNAVRIALLERGKSLREAINRELQEVAASELSVPSAFVEVILSATRQRFELRLQNLEKEFATYDEDVSSCLIILSTLRTELFTQLAHVVYASQIAAQRDLLQALLRELHDQLSRYSDGARSLVANVASLFVAAISAFASMMALALVWRQVGLMRKQDAIMREQTSIAARQLDISSRQDEFTRMLLARKPRLELSINGERASTAVETHTTAETATLDLEFAVYNSGDKAARGFYNNVFIPGTLRLASSSSYLGNLSVAHNVDVGGVNYAQYQNFKDEPVFPERALRIGNLSFHGERGEYKILWQIVAEDGVFPSPARHGEFIVNVSVVAPDVGNPSQS